MKKLIMLTVAILLLISLFIAGCAQQGNINNPTASPGINYGTNNGGNQSPNATVTSSPSPVVSPKNNYTGSGNLGGASDIG